MEQLIAIVKAFFIIEAVVSGVAALIIILTVFSLVVAFFKRRK